MKIATAYLLSISAAGVFVQSQSSIPVNQPHERNLMENDGESPANKKQRVEGSYVAPPPSAPAPSPAPPQLPPRTPHQYPNSVSHETPQFPGASYYSGDTTK